MSSETSALLSMTAYAVIEKTFGKKTFKLHLKTVNHRFTEMRVRLPRPLNALETDVRNFLPKKIQRGSCDFWMEECFAHGQSSTGAVAVKNFFEQLSNALSESKKSSGFMFPAPIRAMILARYPQIWLSENAETETIDRDSFVEAMGELAAQLETNRRIEGKTISIALTDIVNEIDGVKKHIADQVPGLRSEWEKSLRERINKLSQDAGVAPPNEERLLQELLFLGEKRDIAEEIQRIGAHVDALKEALVRPPNNFGRRLEFLLQELHREWTTLGNKIQNVDCSRKVVDAKLALEKMREQSLNIV